MKKFLLNVLSSAAGVFLAASIVVIVFTVLLISARCCELIWKVYCPSVRKTHPLQVSAWTFRQPIWKI